MAQRMKATKETISTRPTASSRTPPAPSTTTAIASAPGMVWPRAWRAGHFQRAHGRLQATAKHKKGARIFFFRDFAAIIVKLGQYFKMLARTKVKNH